MKYLSLLALLAFAVPLFAQDDKDTEDSLAMILPEGRYLLTYSDAKPDLENWTTSPSINYVDVIHGPNGININFYNQTVPVQYYKSNSSSRVVSSSISFISLPTGDSVVPVTTVYSGKPLGNHSGTVLGRAWRIIGGRPATASELIFRLEKIKE
ncbi:hypothetical protein [Cerasicoccus arenae]|uniref:Uncharacterized protein n=1 Tax=Cerasicoccus arenae TaxID=424488 RepID=A0A8J3DHB1_9BACT|nr:hypothetical protein [Cerasicoccus arenae]MBK1857235.1 hypothetical protein [Cerasicoccus arenae]GHC00178.1 hypothetical protein GCM10007047_15550 [Cerasicoccus arenae]